MKEICSKSNQEGLLLIIYIIINGPDFQFRWAPLQVLPGPPPCNSGTLYEWGPQSIRTPAHGTKRHVLHSFANRDLSPWLQVIHLSLRRTLKSKSDFFISKSLFSSSAPSFLWFLLCFQSPFIPLIGRSREIENGGIEDRTLAYADLRFDAFSSHSLPSLRHSTVRFPLSRSKSNFSTVFDALVT